MTAVEIRLCATCGLPLAYSGRGRPPVAHAGSCARTRKNAVEEQRKERAYRETLASAAVLAPPGVTPEHVETSIPEAGTMLRLAAAGYAPLHNDPTEERPELRARNQHRAEVLASLSSVPDANMSGPATDAPVRCLDCPALAYADRGVRGVFTTASLSNLPSLAEDARLRRHLAEDDLGALMSQRPA